MIRHSARMLMLALSVLSLQMAVGQLQADLGVENPLGQAYAQSGEKKKEQETRRTPALRNKVYEKLASAQEFAEAKNYTEALAVLDEMRDTSGKKALNSYELANLQSLRIYSLLQ